MTKPNSAQMTETEFDELIDNYIVRASKSYGEMPGEIFLNLLFDRMKQRANETLKFSIKIQNGGFVIVPDQESDDVLVRNNEILIGERRLVLHLELQAVS